MHWFHKWGKWERFEWLFVWIDYKAGKEYPSKEPWQRRTCAVCNYVQEEQIR